MQSKAVNVAIIFLRFFFLLFWFYIRQFKNIRSSDLLSQIKAEELKNILEKKESVVERIRMKKVKSKVVLVDYFPVPLWMTINSIMIREIGRISDSDILTLNFSRPSCNGRRFLNWLGISKIKIYKIYPSKLLCTWRMFLQAALAAVDKRKFLDFNIDGIGVGMDVYETYLHFGNPTLNVKDFKLWKILFQGIIQLQYLQRLNENREIQAIFASHENFIGPGLLTKFGFKNKIPVILANNFEINLPQETFDNHKRYLRYPLYFESLSNSEKEAGISWASKQLNRRLSGDIGVDMSYQQQSAYLAERIEPQMNKNGNKKILITTHDYFDNPHAYSRLDYNDYLDWLTFLGDFALKHPEVDWYIKVHRDSSQVELEITREFLTAYPQIKWINPEVNFHQLIDEGLDLVITCHGSIGHELPYLGLAVINCGFNPHIGYDFNYHLLTQFEFEERCIQILYQHIDVDRERVLEFYFVHNQLNMPRSFNIPNFDSFIQKTNHQKDIVASLNYVSEYYSIIEELSVKNLHAVLKARTKYSMELLLKPDMRLQNKSRAIVQLANLLTQRVG